MIRGLLEHAYARARGDVEVEESVPTAVLAVVAVRRFGQLLRGLLHVWRYKEHGRFHFRGKRVVVESARYLHIGTNVVFGHGVHISAFSQSGVRLGDRVTLGSRARLLGSGVIREPGKGIDIGDDTAIGMDCTLWGQGGVRIGRDCLFGPGVLIVSENHNFSRVDIPIRNQGGRRAAVVIGDDCWVGAGATILAGSHIGTGSVIGAGAIVTKDVPPMSVAMGIPARTTVGRSDP